MTKHRELDDHLQGLRDIAGILGAMKNFALMETQKLARYLSTQRRVVDTIEAAAGDFLTHYPAGIHRLGRGKPVILLVGSERGLCGDFNETLADRLGSLLQETSHEGPTLILVGNKLTGKLKDDPRIITTLPGPNVTEEIQSVLVRIMDVIREVQSSRNTRTTLNLLIVHHRSETHGPAIQVRRPFQLVERAKVRHPYPPTLTLDPFAFAAELLEHYLLSTLEEVFFSSLMTENLVRFQHMDQAIQRLEKDIGDLTLKRNRLRQEEITEEIEVIMLSAEALRKG
jgi:F-type H+-transporting ATPase subunit gamma